MCQVISFQEITSGRQLQRSTRRFTTADLHVASVGVKMVVVIRAAVDGDRFLALLSASVEPIVLGLLRGNVAE